LAPLHVFYRIKVPTRLCQWGSRAVILKPIRTTGVEP
jgi:hypothetical protein